MKTLDGILFARMINSGAANLKAHAKEINDLNVFPIPDGDTGDNMLMTMMGGVHHDTSSCDSLCEMADRVSSGMLLSARGNSGVILSQFFEGIKNGFTGLQTADTKEIGEAFRQGVTQAYSSVMTPTEGTILTVVREATEYACEQNTQTPEKFLNAFIDEAKRSLARTPELLPVLKKAGVVDSGAAGLIYIVDGMMRAVIGEDIADFSEASEKTQELDLDAFNEDSVLEFGYCTELLVRLQNAKTDISTFDVKVITDYLQTIGDSIVTVRNGSIVKLHVHTMTPQKVLDFCQQYGEFLKVKIENMSLQHNNTVTEEKETYPTKERKKYGVVAVACGEGLKETFRERGADVIVDGGQSMNPSAEDFIEAFDEVNADVIFVFPNNGNIILTAEQAANLYDKSDVRVIESTTIGAGYASLAMLDTSSGGTDAIVEDLRMAMDGVITAEISHCVRDATIDGKEIHTGDYIGFVGKDMLSVNESRLVTVCESIDALNFSRYDFCILICGKDATDEEAEKIEAYVNSHYRGKEIYIINGGQDVYDYIMIVE
ncbi:MAG: DAK2 domain-containing protein [Clostridia bacterium]|nr:DAK2 domain-containing protein [Clostridia bacterium]